MKRRGLLAVFAALPSALMFWRKPTASMDVEWKKLQDVLRDVGLGGHDAVEREAMRRIVR